MSVGALLNTVLVGRVGEAARGVLVHARLNAGGRGAPLPAIVASMVTESLVSTYAWVVLVAGLGLVLPPPTVVWVVLASLSLVGIMIMLAALGRWAVSAREDAIRIVGRGLRAVRRVWSSVIHGHRSLARIDALVPLVAASVLGWLVQGGSAYALLRAFDVARGWEAAALVVVSVTVAQTAPLLPGNVGVFQAAVALPLVSKRCPGIGGVTEDPAHIESQARKRSLRRSTRQLFRNQAGPWPLST